MENADILDGKIGEVGSYEVDFKDGKLVASAKASVEGVEAQMSITVSGKALLDGIAKKIGGPVPEAIANFLELSLGLK